MKNKIVVYSFCYGDVIKFPKIKFNDSNITWIMFSDKKGIPSNGWTVVNPDFLSKFEYVWDKNKYIKWNPFSLFVGKYDYSLYMDAKVDLVENPNDIISRLKYDMRYGFALFKHFCRNCVYDEIEELLKVHRGNEKNILKFKKQLIAENFPHNIGLPETCCILTNLHSGIAKNIQNHVLDTYFKLGTFRDQLAFPYVMYHNNIKLSDVCILQKHGHVVHDGSTTNRDKSVFVRHDELYNNYRKKWVIHWFVQDRETLKLTDTEKHHFLKIREYANQINEFSEIVFSIVINDMRKTKLIEFIKSAIYENINSKRITIDVNKNNPKIGEYITFKKYILEDLDSDKFILYTHFKGVYRNTVSGGISVNNENKWVDLLYDIVFNKCDNSKILNNMICGPGVTVWNEITGRKNRTFEFENIHLKNTYVNYLYECMPDDMYVKYIKNRNDLWAPYGTFYWINCEKTYNYIQSIGFIKSNLIETTEQFSNFERPVNQYIINGKYVHISFANNVSEYFLSCLLPRSDSYLYELDNDLKEHNEVNVKSHKKYSVIETMCSFGLRDQTIFGRNRIRKK